VLSVCGKGLRIDWVGTRDFRRVGRNSETIVEGPLPENDRTRRVRERLAAPGLRRELKAALLAHLRVLLQKIAELRVSPCRVPLTRPFPKVRSQHAVRGRWRVWI
jgi:hypothetical protein